VIGGCDLAFIFGEGSGEKELTDIVAVVEMKVARSRTAKNYHSQSDALCSQIFTSLIGSEAPLGIIVTNGMFKFIWREQIRGFTHFFTYPHGNDLSDFRDPGEKEFFAAVMFEVVRCSMWRTSGSVSAKRQSLTLPRDIPNLQSRRWRYIVASRRNSQNISNSFNGRTAGGRSRAVARDGSVFSLAPFDFTDWSPENYESLQIHLKIEEKQSREQEDDDYFSGSSVDFSPQPYTC